MIEQATLENCILKLLLARKESSQAFLKMSYSSEVQAVFDMVEKRHNISIEYDNYFDECERANKKPLCFDQWLHTQKEDYRSL